MRPIGYSPQEFEYRNMSETNMHAIGDDAAGEEYKAPSKKKKKRRHEVNKVAVLKCAILQTSCMFTISFFFLFGQNLSFSFGLIL